MTTYGAVVLAAGSGMRMKSRTPKVLHRICGKEMITLVVESTKGAGLSRIVVVVPTESDPIRDVLDSGVEFATQSQPQGTGHAVLQARDALEGLDTVLVLVGDIPLIRSETLTALKELHEERESCVTMLTAKNVNTDGLGRVRRDDVGAVARVVEADQADRATELIGEVNCGVYSFRASWLWENLERLKPSTRGDVLLTDLIALAVEQRLTVESFSSKDPEETLGVNNRLHLAKAEAILRDRLRERWMIHGVGMPDPSSVYLDADVELGQDTVVLPNTHITGKTRIGAACRVGPNSMVHNSAIGDRCRITSSMGRRIDSR